MRPFFVDVSIFSTMVERILYERSLPSSDFSWKAQGSRVFVPTNVLGSYDDEISVNIQPHFKTFRGAPVVDDHHKNIMLSVSSVFAAAFKRL